ncbi:transporter substrate-binding domain-containing protein [Chitinibacter bivalviorum]|uniref:Transporter substrate-binding domain-containing protein n=1 Tax=Chitinibacter bivalviorum TaxID=2739434 RepID=A0A7H9BHS8_9NEIS|nr:transporter substrate-binding domain-containing protein [Chitinibacter bivalviorum]QLG87094.1 transporter substrate-binding domain-containing protein [Chitinibacter bivalviorum]
MRIILPLLLAASSLGCYANELIRICAENEWQPFSFSHKNKPTGASVELIQAALASQHIDTQFESGSYNRCLKLTLAGQYDAVLDIAKNAERAPQFLWPQLPFMVMKLHLIANKHIEPEPADYSAVAGKRFGITTGYEYPDELLKQHGLIKIESNSELANFRQLAAGKIDFMLLSEGTLETLSRQISPSERAEIVDWGEVDQLPLYVAFNPKSAQAKQWAKSLDQGLSELQKKGEDKKIFARWRAIP